MKVIKQKIFKDLDIGLGHNKPPHPHINLYYGYGTDEFQLIPIEISALKSLIEFLQKEVEKNK